MSDNASDAGSDPLTPNKTHFKTRFVKPDSVPTSPINHFPALGPVTPGEDYNGPDYDLADPQPNLKPIVVGEDNAGWASDHDDYPSDGIRSDVSSPPAGMSLDSDLAKSMNTLKVRAEDALWDKEAQADMKLKCNPKLVVQKGEHYNTVIHFPGCHKLQKTPAEQELYEAEVARNKLLAAEGERLVKSGLVKYSEPIFRPRYESDSDEEKDNFSEFGDDSWKSKSSWDSESRASESAKVQSKDREQEAKEKAFPTNSETMKIVGKVLEWDYKNDENSKEG